MEDEELYKYIIQQHIQKINGYNDMGDIFDIVRIKNQPIFDLNKRDDDLINIQISDIPMFNNHIGSFIYFASLITAVGRT